MRLLKKPQVVHSRHFNENCFDRTSQLLIRLHPTIITVNRVKYVGNNKTCEEEVLPGPTHQMNLLKSNKSHTRCLWGLHLSLTVPTGYLRPPYATTTFVTSFGAFCSFLLCLHSNYSLDKPFTGFFTILLYVNIVIKYTFNSSL